jgi:hypothetical protein
LECDASGEGIGAILMQNRHYVSYQSRKMRGPKLVYTIYDKKMLDIMNALDKFRQNLVGAKILVRTNHNSLKYFLEKKDLNERQQKWVRKIQAYDFDIEFVKGKNNVFVDALSRISSFYSMTNISVNWKAHLLVDYSKNKFACELMDGHVQYDSYKIIDDIIDYKGRIFLVPKSLFKVKVLQAFHDSPLAWHQWFVKTYRHVRERFAWKGMK